VRAEKCKNRNVHEKKKNLSERETREVHRVQTTVGGIVGDLNIINKHKGEESVVL
jgi:hypothetical protein